MTPYHPNGYQAQLLRCPLLFPQPSGHSGSHHQFAKGVGCVNHINIEQDGWIRVRLDRQSDPYKRLYNQRSAAERINSQAKALGIKTPKVRNFYSVVNLNILSYLVINARAPGQTILC